MPRRPDEPPQARRWAPWLMLLTLLAATWLLIIGYADDGLSGPLLIPAGIAAFSLTSIWVGRYLLGAQDQHQATREALAETATAYRAGIETEVRDKADDEARRTPARLGARRRRLRGACADPAALRPSRQLYWPSDTAADRRGTWDAPGWRRDQSAARGQPAP